MVEHFVGENLLNLLSCVYNVMSCVADSDMIVLPYKLTGFI